jgi:hypothetical protein
LDSENRRIQNENLLFLFFCPSIGLYFCKTLLPLQHLPSLSE